MGCDQCFCYDENTIVYFNPRTHRGVRLCFCVTIKSVHDFNPRTHRGVRRIVDGRIFGANNISIHAPIVGCDINFKKFVFCVFISIHAPIVGCDILPILCTPVQFYFNPRTHRGVRQWHRQSHCILNIFQSTHPSWGAT